MFSKVKRFNDTQKESSLGPGYYEVNDKVIKSQAYSKGLVQSSSDRFKENADTANLGPGEYEGSRVGRKSLGVRGGHVNVHAKAKAVDAVSRPLKNRRKALAAVPQPAVLESETDRVRRRLRHALVTIEGAHKEIEDLKGVADEKESLLREKAEQLYSLKAKYLSDKCCSKSVLESEQQHACYLRATLDEAKAKIDQLCFERDCLQREKVFHEDDRLSTALQDRYVNDELLLSATEELGYQKDLAQDLLRGVQSRHVFYDFIQRYRLFSSLKSLHDMVERVENEHFGDERSCREELVQDSCESTGMGEYKRIQESVTRISGHIAELRVAHSSQTEAFVDTKLRCDKVQQELHQCNAELSEAREHNEKLKRDKIEDEHKLNEEIRKQSVSLSEAQEELSQLSADNYFKSNAMAKFKRELDEQTDKTAKLNSEMQTQKENHSAAIVAMEATNAATVADAYDFQCDKEELVARTKFQEDDLANTKHMLSAQTKENLALNEALSQAKKEVADFNESLEALKSRAAKVCCESEGHLLDLGECKKNLNNVQNELKQSLEEKIAIEDRCTLLKEQVAQLTAGNSNMLKEVQENVRAMEAIRAEGDRKNDILEATKAELGQVRSQYESVQTKLEKAVKAEEQAVNRLRASLASGKKRESENQSLKQELDHLKSSRSAFESRLQEEISKISGKCREWKSQCDMTKERFTRLQEEYRKVKGAQTELQHTLQENDKLNANVVQMQRTIRELTDDLHQVYEGGAFTCKHCEKRLDAEGQEMVAKALQACVSEEAKRISEESARLAGHNNHKQKIRHLKKLKEENLGLKQENIELRIENKRLREKCGARAQRTPVRSRYA